MAKGLIGGGSSNQSGFGQTYLIGGIAIAVLSGLLYWQIRANGAKDGIIADRDAALLASNQTITTLKNREQLSEVVLIANKRQIQSIREGKVDEPIAKVRTIIQQAPPQDCVAAVMSDESYCLLADTCKD